MSKVSFILTFTTSKLLVYIVLAIGSTYSFMYKDAGVLMSTFAAASAIVALKTYTDSRTEQKKLEFPNSNNDHNSTEKDPDL